MTEEVLRGYIAQHEYSDEEIEYCDAVLKCFFPEIEICELKTGDY